MEEDLMNGSPFGLAPVDTMAKLKTLPRRANGDVRTVLGYHAIGDGGGGLFRFDSGSSAEDDRGTTIAPIKGTGPRKRAGRWIRLYSGPLNVKWFGAKGDGTGNDAPFIQAAIDKLAPQGTPGGVIHLTGGVVYLPRGTYRTTSTINLRTQIELRGDGWSSLIKGDTGVSTILLGDPQDEDLSVRGATVANLCIDGGDSSQGRTGLYLTKQPDPTPSAGQAGRQNRIHHVRFMNLAYGLRLVNDQGITVDTCTFMYNQVAVYGSDHSQLGIFIQCDFRNNLYGTIFKAVNDTIFNPWEPGQGDQPYGYLFSRCHWESNTGGGCLLDGCSFITFDTCKWEQNSVVGLRISNSAEVNEDSVGNELHNCQFVGSPDVNGKQLVLESGCYNTRVSGGVFYGGPGTGVVINPGAFHSEFMRNVWQGATFEDKENESKSTERVLFDA
jgi:hypothetical protein